MAGNPRSSEINLDIPAGVGRYIHVVPVTLSTLTNAAQFTIDSKHKGRLIALDFYTHTPATTAAKAATLTPSIAGTDVPGGVIALTTASCDTRNEKTAGSAITAGNAFTASQTIVITASAVTAFLEGTGHLVAVLINDDTVNALARALGGYRTPNP